MDASAKALTPRPQAVSDLRQVFYMYKYIYMLKQDRPEKDNLKEEKTCWLVRKKILADCPLRIQVFFDLLH